MTKLSGRVVDVMRVGGGSAGAETRSLSRNADRVFTVGDVADEESKTASAAQLDYSPKCDVLIARSGCETRPQMSTERALASVLISVRCAG